MLQGISRNSKVSEWPIPLTFQPLVLILVFSRGEQTASALERQLDGIESRIEALLAAAEASSTHLDSSQASGQSPSAGNSKS